MPEAVPQPVLAKPGLHPAEAEVVQLFAHFAHALGQRRSVGEIYGLLFASPVPLSFNDLKERLALSSGSTSQGITLLRDLGAVREVELPGRRRTHYEAVAELRNLTGSFLRRQIAAQFGDAGVRVARFEEQARTLEGEARAFALGRAKLLASWERNARMVLPVLLRLLGGQVGSR